MILTTSEPCLADSRFWCFSSHFNAFFSMNIDGTDARYEGKISSCISERFSISNSCYYDNKIFAFSSTAYEVWVIDENAKDRIVNYIYNQHEVSDGLIVVFSNGVAWAIPQKFCDPIVRYDLATGNTEIVGLGQSDLSSIDENGITYPICNGNDILFMTKKFNQIALVSIDSCSYRIDYRMIEDFESVSFFDVVYNRYYVLGKMKSGQSALFEYGESYELLNKYVIENILIPCNFAGVPYIKTAFFENRLYFIPVHFFDIFSFDLKTKTVKKLLYPEIVVEKMANKEQAYFSRPIQLSDRLFLFSKFLNCICVLNMRNDKFSVIDYSIDFLQNEETGLLKECIYEGINIEDGVIDLNRYIQALSNK